MNEFIKETKDLDLLIESKKQQVASAEQEYLALKKQGIAESYTVSELLKKKAELDEMIANKTKQFSSVNEDWEKKVAELVKVNSDLTVSNTQLLENTEKFNEMSQTIKEEEDKLGRWEKRLSEGTSIHLKEVKDFSILKGEFESKVAKLKEVISTF